MNEFPYEEQAEKMISLDTDNDGLVDSLASAIDLDQDGYFDAMLIASDENRDGTLESRTFVSDFDGDGNYDFIAHGIDFDHDGSMDSEFMVADADGDLKLDLFASVDSSASIWSDVEPNLVVEDNVGFVSFNSDQSDLFSGTYSTYNEVHGSPVEDMILWEQQDDPMSCAVASTNMLFRTVGFEVDESVTAAIFESRGIYDPEFGTNPEYIDEVINEIAISGNLDFHAEEITGFTQDSLRAMLDQGVRPLVCVDSSELYDCGSRLMNEMGLIPDTGHAIQVTGIVHNEDGEFVVINDPGFPDGAGQMIPVETFMNASSDFGNSAVAVVDGAPITEKGELKWARVGLTSLSLGALSMIRNTSPKSIIKSNENR